MTKTIVWTVLGLLVMIGVGFAVTGSFAAGGKMALLNAAIGFVTYFAYEFLWSKIRWGRL